MHALQEEIKEMIIRHHLFTPQDHILVAVSGGVDSVVLVRSLHEWRYNVGIAHMNYQLRGSESEADEAFVRALSQELGVPYFIQKNPPPLGVSIQQWAREERYAWFKDLCAEHGYTHIALGHQSDDQIETILLRFLQRGAGVQAMAGIRPKRGNIVRPMLRLSKQDILAYADVRQWTYRNDSSNQTLHYDRNIIRHSVVPHLKSHFPQFEKVILHNAEQWTETAHLQEITLDKICKKKIIHKGNEIHFPILYLEKSGIKKTLLWRYAEKSGFSPSQLEDIVHLFKSENGHFVASPSHRFIKYQKWLILATVRPEEQTDFIQIDREGTYRLPFGTLKVTRKKESATDIPHHENKNLAIISIAEKEDLFPLLIRKKTQGDYFYPLGMSKKKKLARFLIDLKLSTTEKENVWVACHQKRICWVIGHRIDHRYRVLPSATALYQLEVLGK